METELLVMKNISKQFPGVMALQDVQFSLKKGEVHVLIGENGAGKSTLIKILSGAYHTDSGEVLIEGNAARIENPGDAIKKGISVIYQELNLNPFTPVYENVFLGREFLTHLRFLNVRKAVKETEKLLNMVGLDISPKTPVRKLGVAQQQLVEIAKAMSLQAKIYIFDEPTSALADKEIERLFSIIKDLKASGCGIIYISHRLNELFEIGDRCTVLRDGRYISTKNIDDLNVNELVTMIVGREITESKRETSYMSSETVMTVENLSWGEKLKNVNFNLRKGEILGFAGLMGSGRTELAKCIIGEYRRTGGRITVSGKEVKNSSVVESGKNGIVYLSEDRKTEGLFLQHPVRVNTTIAALGRFVKFGLLLLRKEREESLKMKERLQVKTPSINTLVRNLSGGNQQKVVISKWLMTNANIFIFDEPTRGIDVGAKSEIHKIMEELVRRGASIIMISSEFPEILKMSDRIMVMRLGEVQTILENDALTQEDVFHYAIGGHTLNNKKNTTLGRPIL